MFFKDINLMYVEGDVFVGPLFCIVRYFIPFCFWVGGGGGREERGVVSTEEEEEEEQEEEEEELVSVVIVVVVIVGAGIAVGSEAMFEVYM